MIRSNYSACACACVSVVRKIKLQMLKGSKSRKSFREALLGYFLKEEENLRLKTVSKKSKDHAAHQKLLVAINAASYVPAREAIIEKWVTYAKH